MNDQAGETARAKAGESVKVIRDNNFHRFAADKMLIVSHGRELEVTFLAMDIMYNSFEDGGDVETFKSQPVFSEVAKMRIDYPVMINSIMGFIENGIRENQIKGEAMSTRIMEWAEAHKDEESKSESKG